MVGDEGLEAALQMNDIPAPARQFMSFTFDVIGRNQAHLLAAVLAYGRETLVPQLFRSLIEGLQVNASEAPGLYGYLERHVQLDEQEHGPLAVLMVQELCEGSSKKLAEAMDVAEQALAARLDFWNGIHAALPA
jgi:pyrroloquinoline quinone (PQQ) biosynthesis protein C